MLPLPPAENSLVERYLVNFTTDLSDTLAEVKHLEHLGFTVPEVARNMSLQEGKLTGIAADLKELLDRYHAAVDSLEPAEVRCSCSFVVYHNYHFLCPFTLHSRNN